MATQAKVEKGGMRIFYTVWAGQLLSTIGSGLTAFALGIWLYQETNSVFLFAMNSFFYMVPGILLSPFAGVIADKYDRRKVMIFADTVAGIGTLFAFTMMATGQLEFWHVYVAAFLNSVGNTFQWPTWGAATTLLVPKKDLGRAGGMSQIGEAVSQLAGPVIAGGLYMLPGFGVRGILAIDAVSFLFALGTLLVVRFPQPIQTEEGQKANAGSIWVQMAFGWYYIKARKGLLLLLAYFATVNLLWGMIGPLFTPMMLNLVNPAEMGISLTVMGMGMLIGTLIISAWGGPKRRVVGILLAGFLSGIGLMFVGVTANIYFITAAGFFIFLTMPMMNASSQALWQTKTAVDVQGRVFAVRRTLAQATGLIAPFLAGPLADRIFEPAMMEGGAWASSIGRLIGTGPGRGMGVLLIIVGALSMVSSVAFYGIPRLRHVEDELPDATVEEDENEVEEVTTSELVGEPAPAK